MTQAQAKRLENFFDNGYLILIDASGLVDGPVESVWLDQEPDSDTNGEMVYDSEVFRGKPLRAVSLNEVRIFRPVSFKHAQIEFVEGQGNDDNYDENGNLL